MYRHTETPTHIETRTHDQSGDKIEKSKAPDDGCINVRNMLKPATRIPPQPSHTETPTNTETRIHDHCCDTIEYSLAPDDGCINVRNMLSIEEVKQNLITSDIKLISYSSTNMYI